jgi:hypothetical protein
VKLCLPLVTTVPSTCSAVVPVPARRHCHLCGQSEVSVGEWLVVIECVHRDTSITTTHSQAVYAPTVPTRVRPESARMEQPSEEEKCATVPVECSPTCARWL